MASLGTVRKRAGVGVVEKGVYRSPAVPASFVIPSWAAIRSHAAWLRMIGPSPVPTVSMRSCPLALSAAWPLAPVSSGSGGGKNARRRTGCKHDARVGQRQRCFTGALAGGGATAQVEVERHEAVLPKSIIGSREG